MSNPILTAARGGWPERRREAGVQAPTPFWDAVGRAVSASAQDGWRNRTGGWRAHEWRTMLMERNAQVRRLTGERLALSDEMMDLEDGPEADHGRMAALGRLWSNPFRPLVRATTGYLSIEDYEARLDALRERYPQLADVPTRQQLWEQHDADLRGVRGRASAAAADGAGGRIGGFVGDAGAAIADPVNLGAAVLTGGVGAGRGLLVRMAQQAGIGVGVEATQVAGRAADAVQYGGPEYSAAEAALDVAAGGVGGAGFEALGSAGRWGLTRLGRALAGSLEPEARGLSAQIERLMDDEAVIGRADDFDAARAALARGEAMPAVEPERDLDALFSDPASSSLRNQSTPSAMQAGGLTAAEYRGRTIHAGRFDPLRVEADPVRFQYKADGDAEGVTGRLRGVERWDATASGKALLFEDVDGRVIVADGHQRRGLARRLAEQGWEDAQLDGYLFRAADGWTAPEVRVVAALKNIREGSGAVLDAAKVFREAPAALNDRSLPVTGDFIASARQLASLSDDAFRAVINGVVPERYAAVIGEQAGARPELHADLVELIRRGEPKSIEGARALVQEGLLDDFIKAEGLQMDLFGGLPRESTVIARGRIREAVLAGLRRDERLNSGLVRHADAIEAGGNVLARTENEARLAVDRAASELVSRLALRSGEMGEAFSAAAAAVTKGETTPGAAAKGLLQRIRAAVAAGERLDDVRAEVLDPAPPAAQALEAAGAYDAPGGAAQRAQVEPKPEDVEIEAEAQSLGLFDDLPEADGAERALSVLGPCAPGRA